MKPDDPVITDMDPVLEMWMYNNWVQDKRDKYELAKDHAYLLGSFSNPEEVKRLMDSDKFLSSDEEFEKSSEMIRSGVLDKKGKRKKRRNRRLKS